MNVSRHIPVTAKQVFSGKLWKNHSSFKFIFFVVDSKEVPDYKKLEQTLWNPDGADRNDRIMSSDQEDGYVLIIV